MKRIVFFKTSLSSGGAERQLCSLASFLADKGYEVIITTFSDVDDHYTLSNDIRRKRLAPGKSNIRKYIAIWKYFLTVKTNVILGFGVRENFIMLPSLFFRKRIKVIACERNATLLKPAFYEKIDHSLLYYRADYIVANSYTQANYLKINFPKWSGKVSTVINYSDIQLYRPVEMHIQDCLHIGIFARYDAQKNCLPFAAVVDRLKEKFGQCFRISWYGDKNSPLYIELEKFITTHNLGDVFLLNDKVKDVVTKMKEFDVMCLPSLYEGFSNSVSEYICCGKPVICSDVSDNSIMVHNGENGFLFNPKSKDNMISAFENLFALRHDEIVKMGRRSREIAEELFDKDKFINSYISLIES